MSFTSVALLLSIIAVGTYFQTITGFGLAMIVIGIVSGFAITDVAFIASVVSLISIVNSGVALPKHLHHIQWRTAGVTLIGIIPASVLGVILLKYLGHEAGRILEFLLGLVIVYSGVRFALRPKQRDTLSSDGSFLFVGFISGLCGGLFGMPGPPLIFHMYRQPLGLHVVRNMLLLLFCTTSFTRTLYEAAAVGIPADALYISVMAIPVVAIFTVIGQRFPPPISAMNMRRLTFITLILIGLGLINGSIKDLLF